MLATQTSLVNDRRQLIVITIPSPIYRIPVNPLLLRAFRFSWQACESNAVTTSPRLPVSLEYLCRIIVPTPHALRPCPSGCIAWSWSE